MEKQYGFGVLLLILFILLSACPSGSSPDYFMLNDPGDFKREAAFLSELLEDPDVLGPLSIAPAGAEARGTASIVIDFSVDTDASGPEGAAANAGGPKGIPISRTWLVPRADPLAGRANTTLAACAGGVETLIPLEELRPPYTALRVDGLSVEDPGYPLVREVRINLRAASPEKKKRSGREQRRIAEKIAALEGLLRDSPKPLVMEQPEILWIASAGDLMLGRGAEDILLKEGPEGIFGGTAALLAGADLALVNLEGAVSSRGTKAEKAYNFRFDPRTAPALKDAGIDAVLLANNHVFDYGETAFLDSLSHLQNTGINILGAGLNDTEAARPRAFRKGKTAVQVFGLASFPQERSGWDGLRVAAEADKPGLLHAGRKGNVEQLKAHLSRDEEEALDIVLFHGGDEWSRQPNASTRQLITDLIQQGADLIIGSHPHIVQGFEWVAGKPVFWSLGNYVFAGMDNTAGGDEGLFIRLGFAGSRMVYLEPYALTLSQNRTALAPQERVNNFYELSKALAPAPVK
ncbi:hypothetical protein AGMMS49587_13840 [Spirochaetia bacterium]|nr:hypothetical protein AGMMS49587_13840 [Spirochaetia bacterium]